MDQQLILDRYRPLQQLARGGFAEVVLAYDTRMQRRVAIKRLPFPRDGSGRVTAPVGLVEARTAALLNHPNIVSVHEWDTDADEAFIIMEYVDGTSLAEILDREGPPGLDAAAAVVEAVASALQFAHENGVLHLDIKPENVLVTHAGHVKVTDFGISALSTAIGHGPNVGGTPGFMPLEQLQGEDVDERTDVWAFAALCFELLVDANPFATDSIEGAIFKAGVIDPPAPSEFDRTLPAAIDDILLAALATHPGDRYGTVAGFAARLLDHLGRPDQGRVELAEVVASLQDEQIDVARDWERIGLWDRTRPWSGFAVRALAAATSGWLAWVGLAELTLSGPAHTAGALLVAFVATAVPALGTALGLGAFAVGLISATGWAVGTAFLLAITPAWWYAGRRENALLGGLAAPPLGIARLAPAAPLLTGFGATPLKSAVAGATGAALTMLASAASGGRAPYLTVTLEWFADPLSTRIMSGNVRELVSTPAPLAVLAAWAGAALAMSLACRRAARTAAIGGWVLGVAMLYAGYALADVVARSVNASVTWTGDALLPHLAASSILVVLVIAAGAPARAEEE
ncbi:MAG: serine/threonine protein kinase [Coriobacteriia bacterium]|nr:serine/threonine protein kinase [Coriobacteriia bacterium]